MTAWYCAYTHAGMEKWARSNLWERGFDAYLPLYARKRRHARRTDWVERPLFPRYMFVAADLEAGEKPKLMTAPGVDHLVAFGRHPARVDARVIEELKARENDRGLIDLDRTAGLKPGDRVVVDSGALVEQAGLFECMSDKERVIVLLNLLGRQVRVTVPATAIGRPD